MAQQYIFTIENLSKAHGKKDVLKGIWLSFYPGAKIGVLGGNGAGKSTLLRIMAGVDKDFLGTARPDAGIFRRLSAAGADARTRAKTVLGNVEEAVAPTRAPASRGSTRSTPGSVKGRTTTRWTPCSKSKPKCKTPSRPHTPGISTASSKSPWTPCGCRPATPRWARSPAARSAGSRSASCCFRSPDILLLDEPTNHLDAESVAWLERHLQEYPGTVVAVTHDRYFLDNVAGWILELDRGQGIPWQGNYSSWLEQKQERLALEEKQESNRRKTLQRELEWVRMAPRARVAKNRARHSAI